MAESHPVERSGVAPMLWCLLAAALFGASTPASKQLLASFGPLTLAAVMYAGAALAVAPRALAGWSASAVDRRDVWRLAGVVLFGGVVGPVLLLKGLAQAASASVSLWLSLEMVATACLARLIFREHLAARTWLSVGLVVAASVLLSTGGTGADARAALLVAGACLAWGLDNNLTALIQRFTPAQVTFVKGTVAAAVNLAAGLWLEAPVLHVPALLQGLCVGGLGYGASLLLYVAGARRLGATRAQVLFSTAPVWGLVVAWLVAGEPVRGLQLGAAALMALAAGIIVTTLEPGAAQRAISSRAFRRAMPR